MTRIYVAGAYSADNVIDVLGNMRRGIQIAAEILLAGYAPFAPWLDYQFSLTDAGADLTVEDYYRYSLAWLDVSDAVVIVPESQYSKGVRMEIERAGSLSIPVYSWEVFRKIMLDKSVEKGEVES